MKRLLSHPHVRLTLLLIVIVLLIWAVRAF